MSSAALLSVERLSVSIGPARPLDDVGFALAQGEILGVVGESGAGKSLTAMAVMGLLPLIGGRIESGAIRFDGIDLARLPEEAYRKLRGKRIGLITQNPMTSLDPIIRVGQQIDQVSRLHLGLGRAAARARSIELMGNLRIPEPAAVHDLYPHQLSGGMKQRAVIAMALAADPDLIVADEPTTALDVTVQAQIIQLLVDLVRDRRLSLMLITHDMGVVAQACDRVAVMYGGRVVERGEVKAIFAGPRHPYTRALIGCIPRAGMAAGALKGIPGTVPSVTRYPGGCRFHPRCAQAQARCQEVTPLFDGGPTGDGVACHFPNGPQP
jgi:peptide/nickel transport system ATP-binding protein